MEIKSKEIKIVDIDSIIPNPKNANIHSQEQIERLEKLIKFQGMRNPLIVSNRSGFLVAGHGRLIACKNIGLKEVPVIYQDFENEAQEYAYIISDNEIARWSKLDMDLISLEIPNLDIEIENLGLNFDFSKIAEVEIDDEEKEETLDKKYLLEVQLHNELDMRDLYDDLISKGFMVREK